ncbi:MAG: TonB-dependent receptor [Burkholderiales bacterium]
MATTRKFLKFMQTQRRSMHFNPLIFFGFLCTFWPPSHAHAQQATQKFGYLTEQDFLVDMPVVLGASRLPQSQHDAPGPVTVIDRDTIAASGFTTVPDVLRLVPGMYVGYFKGHTPIAALHGLAAEQSGRMQVLIDGRSVYSSLNGSVAWADIPLLLDDIECIEVLRGPNSAVFGSNAFMGVINIITREPATTPTAAKLDVGDDGQRRLTGRYAGKGGAWNYRLSAGYKADDGIKNVFDDYNQKFLDLRADYQPTNLDALQFGAGYSNSKRERGFVDDPIDQPHTEFIHSYYADAKWRRIIAADKELTVQLYHSNDGLNGKVTTLPVAGQSIVVDTPYDWQRTDIETQYIFSPANDWRVVAGGGMRSDSVRSQLYLGRGKGETNNNLRLFAHTEWHANSRLNVNAGAMLEDTSYVGREFSPRIALNYRLALDHGLRVSFSRATRTPNIYEEKGDVHFNFSPTPLQYVLAQGGLSSEVITSREIGYIGHFREQGLTLDLRAYRDELKNLIGTFDRQPPDPFAGAKTDHNSEKASICGYEVGLRYRPDSIHDLMAAYASTRISAESIITHEVAEFTQRAMPDNVINLLARRKFGQQWQGSLGYYQMSKTDQKGDGEMVPLMRRLDMRMAYHFGAIQNVARRGQVALVLQNLLDSYQDFKRDNVASRRAYLSVNLEW